MGKGVVSDLSSEMPSDRVPPGRHHFEGIVRIPIVGWRVKLTAKAPDRSPAAVATGVLALAVVALAVPAVLAVAAAWTTLPTWIVPGAAAAFAVTMACTTRFALWYQHNRPRARDLTKLEGDPTDRADVLIHTEPDRQQHQIEVSRGQTPWTSVSWDSSPRSLPGLGMAFLILATAAVAPGAAITGLAAWIHAATAPTVISAVITCLASGICGSITMIRIEQLERDSPERGRGHPQALACNRPACEAATIQTLRTSRSRGRRLAG